MDDLAAPKSSSSMPISPCACGDLVPRFSYANLVKFEKQFIEEGRKGTSDLQLYTGFCTEEFEMLWDFLDPVNNIRSWEQAEEDTLQRKRGSGPHFALSLKDQLLVLLMRLRLNLLEWDLAFRFNVSEATISRMLNRWINFCYLRLGSLPIWPTWERVEESMPDCFQQAYPTTYCVIDATEIFCETPSSLPLQSQCYSNYKSHCTLKGLVAVAPNGAIIFISELFNGAISDRQLTIQSGFLEMLALVPKGKSVMADRGFEIQDLMLKHEIFLNTPPFRDGDHLKQDDVMKTQKIARVRIHVERVVAWKE